jgi:short-subunit dehydrogenase
MGTADFAAAADGRRVVSCQLPLLQLSSAEPAFSTLGSLAGLVPAPTRALYGASKAGQHMLLQGLALEAAAQAKADSRRAHVRFLHVLPGTIATGFRAGAVDGAPEESGARDSSWDRESKSDVLTAEHVAQQTILAVDRQTQGELLMPPKYRFARLGMALL